MFCFRCCVRPVYVGTSTLFLFTSSILIPNRQTPTPTSGANCQPGGRDQKEGETKAERPKDLQDWNVETFRFRAGGWQHTHTNEGSWELGQLQQLRNRCKMMQLRVWLTRSHEGTTTTTTSIINIIIIIIIIMIIWAESCPLIVLCPFSLKSTDLSNPFNLSDISMLQYAYALYHARSLSSPK